MKTSHAAFLLSHLDLFTSFPQQLSIRSHMRVTSLHGLTPTLREAQQDGGLVKCRFRSERLVCFGSGRRVTISRLRQQERLRYGLTEQLDRVTPSAARERIISVRNVAELGAGTKTTASLLKSPSHYLITAEMCVWGCWGGRVIYPWREQKRWQDQKWEFLFKRYITSGWK